MTTRTLIGLGLALVVLALLAFYGQREDTVAMQDGGRLMPDLQASLDEVDRLSVAGAESATIATVERRENAWIVTEKDGYPADVVKIRQVLLDLAEANIVEQKTSNPDYYDRLGVQPIESDTAVGVAVTAAADGTTFPTVIVGDLAATGYRYVRRSDEAVSYLVDRALDIPRSTSEWVDPAIVDVRGARVRQVTIEHPDGETLRVTKDDAAQTNFTVENIPEGRELQYPGVANVIGNALRELRLEDVESSASPPEGAPEPVRVEFRTFDGLVVSAVGYERDGEAWVEFSASVDTQEAGAAAESTDDNQEGAEPEAGERTAAAETENDPDEEAAAINERVAGWRYRIASYQFDQMTRRMNDLLQAVEQP